MPMSRRVSLQPKRTKASDRLFKAIANRSRRRILKLLADEELPLNRIEERFQMSRPAVIKHLRVLKSCRLVQARKSGRETLHRLNAEPLRVLKDWVSHFESQWDDHLQMLKQQVESEP
jgi:DNA-binding transcriptional ArsR family regulator